MKRFILYSIFCITSVLSSNSQIKDGFYRVRNLATDRYIYILDNTGSINIATTSADMGALKLWKGKSKALTDPATVVYAEYKHKGSYGDMYDLQAQGTGVYGIIGYYVNIYPYTSTGAKNQYYVYAEGKYLTDPERSSRAFAYLGTTGSGDYRIWIAEPIDLEDNYLAVTPTITANGKYYAPYYVGFAISFPSTNIKAQYISKIVGEYAVMSDITSDVVPASTPILIECASNEETDNKLNVLKSNTTFSGTNLLKGVYFNYDERPKSKDARKAYDPQTMRVLGLTSEGKLGYITADIDYLPANQSYLVVPAGTAKELTIVTEAEYIAGINNIKVENRNNAPVYDLNGKKVSETNASIHSLPQGIYISGGKKIKIK